MKAGLLRAVFPELCCPAHSPSCGWDLRVRKDHVAFIPCHVYSHKSLPVVLTVAPGKQGSQLHFQMKI